MTLPFWLRAHWQTLTWTLSQARPAHALLLLSRPGLGGELLARAYAERLLCVQATGAEFACGQCAGCALTKAGHHPDWISVTIAEDKKGLSIEQIRELTVRLQQRAHRGGFRVAILHDADTMSSGAANALLKTLEEPGADSVLMLLSTQPEKISATIRSRCSRVLIQSPTLMDARDWLATQTSHTAEQIEQALRESAGAPLLALQRLQDNDDSARQLTLQIDALLRRETDPLQMAANCGDAERLLDALLRRSHAGMQSPSAMIWGELSELTLESRRQLRAANNLIAQNVIEQLLLRWFDLARKLDHSKLA